jgi:uncharacterized protein (TIGR00251 family)
MNRKYQLHKGKVGSAISVRVATRMPRTELIGIMDDGTLKITLNSAPVDGKANDELVRYLSEVFQLPRSNIEIVAGNTSKNKLISLIGIEPGKLEKITIELLGRKD